MGTFRIACWPVPPVARPCAETIVHLCTTIFSFESSLSLYEVGEDLLDPAGPPVPWEYNPACGQGAVVRGSLSP